MHAKNQDRSPRRKGFISVSRDFTPYFHFRCVARTTFVRNLIYSADACFLVMACVGYSCVQLKTLSSLLKLIQAQLINLQPELITCVILLTSFHLLTCKCNLPTN